MTLLHRMALQPMTLPQRMQAPQRPRALQRPRVPHLQRPTHPASHPETAASAPSGPMVSA
jgi:hypothetical protein